MPPILRLLRPKQWSKNLLVFGALVFTARFRDPWAVGEVLRAFVALGLVSSASYALNDALDVEADKLHPTKCNRPVAAGLVSVTTAKVVAALSLLAGLGLGLTLLPGALAALAVFALVQLTYNLFMKPVAVADVMLISLAFVLRAAIGALALHVRISLWLLLCTGALALLLGFAKRRHEFLLGERSGARTRASLSSYSLPALDAFVVISASIASIAYGLYAIQSETAKAHPSLMVTLPFVLYGIFRYLLRVFKEHEGGEPENLLFSDPHLVGAIAMFLLTSIAVMSGFEIPGIR